MVCGGPPCQSFSLAGKRKKFDKKDDLFSHYLEVIKVLQPKYFIMENVKGILGDKHFQTFMIMITTIFKLLKVHKIKVNTCVWQKLDVKVIPIKVVLCFAVISF